MSTIPLPALGIKPPEQPDLLGQVAKMRQIQGMGQEQQLRQGQLQLQHQQLKDEQAMTAAMQTWDGKDYDSLAKSVLRNGGSANAATQIQQHGLTIKKTVSDIAKQDSETGSKNLETFIGKHKAIGDAIAGLSDVPDAQLHDAVVGKISELAQGGILDPQAGQQMAQQVGQIQDPAQLRQSLGNIAKTTAGATYAAEQAKTAAQTKEAGARANEADATTAKTQLETKLMEQYGTSQQQEAKYIALQARKNQGWPLSAADTAFAKAYEKNKTLVPTATFNLQNAGATGTAGQPSAMAKAVAAGDMKWSEAVTPRTPMSVKQALLAEVKQIKPDFNSGDFDVEKKAKEVATSGTVGQQLLAIGTAREHMKTFRTLAEALDNGNVQVLNKIGNAIGVQFGSDKKTNFDIAAQAFGGEVGKAFDGAGVVAGEREQAQKNFNAAMANGQFKGAIDIVDKLLAGKQKAAHDWFDKASQAKPDFGGNDTQGNDPAASSGKVVSLSAARQLPGNKGKSDADIRSDIKAHGYQVKED